MSFKLICLGLQEVVIPATQVVCYWPMLAIREDDKRTETRTLSMEYGHNWCPWSRGKYICSYLSIGIKVFAEDKNVLPVPSISAMQGHSVGRKCFCRQKQNCCSQ